MFVFQHINYHGVSSVAEILLKNCERIPDEQIKSSSSSPFALVSLVHPFPYGLSTTQEALNKVKEWLIFLKKTLVFILFLLILR